MIVSIEESNSPIISHINLSCFLRFVENINHLCKWIEKGNSKKTYNRLFESLQTKADSKKNRAISKDNTTAMHELSCYQGDKIRDKIKRI